MELISAEVPRDFFRTALWLAARDYGEDKQDEQKIEDLDAVDYISDFMARFISNERFLSVFQDAQTLTERVLLSEKKDAPWVFRENADFALFSAGMFPERLAKFELRGHYEKRGAVSYLRAFVHSDCPTFQKLAYGFRHFEGVITNARDNYMRVTDGTEGVRVIPVYENIPPGTKLN